MQETFLTLKEALHPQEADAEPQHWEFVQFGDDICTEGQQTR